MQVKEDDRKPSKHAYCLNKAHQCFARHTAAAYKIMNAIGGHPTKKEMVSHAEQWKNFLWLLWQLL
jgi:hypothetical protein